MADKDYSKTFTLDATPEVIFKSITQVTRWWTENLTGSSEKLDDEFEVRFGDVHFSRHRLIEVVPSTRMVWLTTDCKLNFISDQTEWTNTRISFDITRQGDASVLTFTHHGLMPAVECYEACSTAWGDYLSNSLVRLIRTGKGNPAVKETAQP